MIKALYLVLFAIFILTSRAAGFGIPEVMGPQRFAVVLIDYANNGSAQPVAEITDRIFNSDNSVAAFINAASYGKTTITGDVFGWIIPGEDEQLYDVGWTACWPLDQDRFNLLVDNYPGVDLTAYDGFIFYVNRAADPSCSSSAVANGYGKMPRETYTSFGTINTRILYASTQFYFPYEFSRITNSPVAHEIIHTFGISIHSNSYTCGDQVLSTNPDECFIQAYGDILLLWDYVTKLPIRTL